MGCVVSMPVWKSVCVVKDIASELVADAQLPRSFQLAEASERISADCIGSVRRIVDKSRSVVMDQGLDYK